MNWKDLGQTLINLGLPTLGGALAGPAGAAVGKVLAAKVTGRADAPAADLNKLLTENAEALAKARKLEMDHEEVLFKATVEAETKLVESVNQTMRAEGQSEHWPQWSWRPFWGFVSALAFGAVCVYTLILMDLAIRQHQPDALRAIPDLISSMTMLFAIPGGILGVASWFRGKSKLTQ